MIGGNPMPCRPRAVGSRRGSWYGVAVGSACVATRGSRTSTTEVVRTVLSASDRGVPGSDPRLAFWPGSAAESRYPSAGNHAAVSMCIPCRSKRAQSMRSAGATEGLRQAVTCSAGLAGRPRVVVRPT